MRWDGRTERALALLGWSMVLVGCVSHFEPGSLRFANHSPAVRVNDTRLVPKPSEREYLGLTDNVRSFVRRPVLETWAIREKELARNINALGEVPDSTWFENRIGTGTLTPEDVLRGPLGGEGPDTSGPWVVLGTKTGGSQLGLTVVDEQGVKYILKFDLPKAPELDSGTDAVVSRLLWALGYHVPGDAVVHFERDDLVLSPTATRTEPDGKKRPLRRMHLDALLGKIPPPVPGKGYRGLTSRFLKGEPIGGYAVLGTREDDPNDVIPHQHRRELRAQWVFFGWLKHTDMKEDNSLDMWIEREPGRGYVMHYLVDFGKALGAKGYAGQLEHDGWAHHIDYSYGVASILALGMWKRPWEGIEPTGLRGVGRFDADHFRADRFRTSRPYATYYYLDRFDGYWAAKQLMKLSDAHIRAAVRAGKFSDPRAEQHIGDTLVARQRIIGDYWFRRVNPVDEWQLSGERLCAVDLAVRYGFREREEARYHAFAFDYGGYELDRPAVRRSGEGGQLCLGLPDVPSGRAGYTMVALDTWHGENRLPLVVVHMARDEPNGSLRIIGIDRQ